MSEHGLGDGDERCVPGLVDPVDPQRPVDAEGHEEVQDEADEPAGHQCLGDVVGGVLVLGPVDGGGLPAAGAPLSDGQASQEQRYVADGPGPSGRRYLGGYVVEAEHPYGVRSDEDDHHRDDGDDREDHAHLGPVLDSAGAEGVHQGEDREHHDAVEPDGRPSIEVEGEHLRQVVGDEHPEDHDHGGPREPVAPGAERADELALVVSRGVVLVGEDLLRAAGEADGVGEACGHLPVGEILRESLQDGEHPHEDRYAPYEGRDVVQ